MRCAASPRSPAACHAARGAGRVSARPRRAAWRPAAGTEELTLSSTIKGRPSASARASSRATHTTPDVWRTMKAIASVVIVSAAQMRSPSFSRSSSSMTTTNCPAATAASASGIEANPGVGSSASSGSGASGCQGATAAGTRNDCARRPRAPRGRLRSAGAGGERLHSAPTAGSSARQAAGRSRAQRSGCALAARAPRCAADAPHATPGSVCMARSQQRGLAP